MPPVSCRIECYRTISIFCFYWISISYKSFLEITRPKQAIAGNPILNLLFSYFYKLQAISKKECFSSLSNIFFNEQDTSAGSMS